MTDEAKDNSPAGAAAEPENAAEPESLTEGTEETDESTASAPSDPLDEELADLVEATGPISKEAELLADLQRLQAEFVNYKARVERDRDVARHFAIAEVFKALLPALDDLARAQSHGDLEGSPFAAVAQKLHQAGERFGLQAFGAVGDRFNPEQHDALVQTPSASVTETVVADVIESGFMLGDRMLRAAKVAVFIPADENSGEAE